MVKILDDSFMVCTDCLMIIANDDATGLDYSMTEEEAAVREREIRDVIAELQRSGGRVAVGDSALDDAFSATPCACCRSRLAGPRHHCVLLA
jgi:hypothetical protein